MRPGAHSGSAVTILTCMVGFSCGQCFSVARPAFSIRCGQRCSWCRAGPQNVLQRVFPRRCHQVVLGLKLFNHHCFGYFRCLTSYSERTPPPQSIQVNLGPLREQRREVQVKTLGASEKTHKAAFWGIRGPLGLTPPYGSAQPPGRWP